MRVVIQRVSSASASIDQVVCASIEKGLLVLLGIENEDTREDVQWLAKKIVQLRIFNDGEGLMNRDLREIRGKILLVSQFTLHASYKKGNRPSFIKAAKPEYAKPLYTYFISELEQLLPQSIATGEFGADMKVALVNDGPVTIFMDSQNKE